MTLAHTASGGDYVTVTKDLPVTITDDDTAAIVLSGDGPHRDGGRRGGVELHGQAGHTALGQRHGHHLRTRQHRPDAGRDDADLHGGQLEHRADGDVKAGQDNGGANDTGTLTHTASGGDYVTVTKDLPVRVTDDDTAAIALSGWTSP